jgi:hypothetical protein
LNIVYVCSQQQQQMTSRTTGAVQDTLNALGRVEEEEMARLVQEVSVITLIQPVRTFVLYRFPICTLSHDNLYSL